ncbi:DUF4136 domain-containing protein [Winogradskyella luteola]|uniref:DUF4136 domain-containing protein n=1 Tax=Winogradskyella luteola TaxID=2828330 RepID=A0A9X1FBB7_9FLAO|nr:DUF4136 domain-containing protein [Winogradskyella luteola]MBV7270687.1 DUF4136 domain-containing protein [Winogradskyella luteola]
MKKISKCLLVIGLLILVSCASNVKTKKYTDEDFKNFKTFAYLPNTAFDTDEFNNGSDKSIEESLIAVMNDKMVEKGFSVNRDNPDLLVLLTTSNEIKSNLQNRNNFEQAPIGGGNSNSPNYASVSSTDYKRYYSKGEEEISNRPYKKGTLIVEVFNRKSKELIWVGIAEDFKAHISDQTLMTRMINEVFKEFPR